MSLFMFVEISFIVLALNSYLRVLVLLGSRSTSISVDGKR